MDSGNRWTLSGKRKLLNLSCLVSCARSEKTLRNVKFTAKFVVYNNEFHCNNRIKCIAQFHGILMSMWYIYFHVN